MHVLPQDLEVPATFLLVPLQSEFERRRHNHMPSDTPHHASEDTFDYAAARRFLDQKQARIARTRHALWERAKADADCIVQMIHERYRPRRIIQWGSVLHPEQFTAVSDIDLAVEGIDAVSFMRLCADAEELTVFPLDLVHLDVIDPHFKNILERKGVER